MSKKVTKRYHNGEGENIQARIDHIVRRFVENKKIKDIDLDTLTIRLRNSIPPSMPNFKLSCEKGVDGYAMLRMDFETPFYSGKGDFTQGFGFKFEEAEDPPDPDFMKNLESL